MHRPAAIFLVLLLAMFTGTLSKAGAEEIEPVVSWGTSIVPFSYSNSDIKSNGFTAGLYTNIGYGLHHSLETEIDYTRIDYKGFDDLKQWDYTAVYTHYRGGYRFRGGLHYVSANYDFADGLVTAIAGIGHYSPGRWHAALNGYYSWYNDDEPDLKIYQATPEIGRYFLKTPNSWFRVVARGYYIQTDTDNGFFEEEDYLSAEAELTWYTDPLTLKVSGWAGEQRFAVREDGFRILNLAEKYTGGFGAGLDYVLGNGLLIGFEVAVELFEEFGIDDDAARIDYLLIIGARF